MSFEDATAALEGAINEDAGGEAVSRPPSIDPNEQAQPQPSTTPEGETATPQVQPQTETITRARDPQTGRFIQADGTLAPEETSTSQDTFDDGKFNPDTLDPALQPGWKQLQADYTRKMQALAERQRQFEQYGDPQTVANAVELFNALQDPNYLRQFHGELTQALQAQGYSPEQASATAAAETQKAGGDLSSLSEDPELAPVVTEVQQLRQQVQAMQAREQAAQQQRDYEALQQQTLGEIQRQEFAIREANPHYGQNDIDAIMELAAFHNGDLFAANLRYAGLMQRAVEEYTNQKTAVLPSGVEPVSSTGISTQPTRIETFDDADRAAQEYAAKIGLDLNEVMG